MDTWQSFKTHSGVYVYLYIWMSRMSLVLPVVTASLMLSGSLFANSKTAAMLIRQWNLAMFLVGLDSFLSLK